MNRKIVYILALGAIAAIPSALEGNGAAAAQTTVLTDMAALNAQASALDPDEYRFVQPVCTRCHTPAMFLHARTWSEWQSIFNDMSTYGAQATPAQWEHIYKYFQRNLTQIDVNHADEDELSSVLGVDQNTAVAIVRRRADHRLDDVAGLEAIPGVDKETIEAMRARILFDPPPDEQ